MAPHEHTLADGPDGPRLAAIGELLARGLRRLDIMRRRGSSDGRAAACLDLQAGLSVTVPTAAEPRMKEAQR
jgi:hypothetical protein